MITSLLLLTIYYNEKKKINDVEYQNVKICRRGDYIENSLQVLVDGMRQTSRKLHVHIYTSML